MIRAGLMRTRVAAILAACLLSSASHAAEIVYDNTTTPTASNWIDPLADGFWPFSQYDPYGYIGDAVTLDATTDERALWTFDLLLSSSQPVTLDTLELTLFDTDGLFPVEPALWTDTLTDVHVDGLTTVTFDIHGEVTAPDTFVWAISADSLYAGPATFGPATVGESPRYAGWSYCWNKEESDINWLPLMFSDDSMNIPSDPPADFGARITAVPEPTAGLVLFAGTLVALRRRLHPPR